jgi:hypothetical protein
VQEDRARQLEDRLESCIREHEAHVNQLQEDLQKAQEDLQKARQDVRDKERWMCLHRNKEIILGVLLDRKASPGLCGG